MKSFDELITLIEKRGLHAAFGAAGEGWALEQNSFELAAFLTRMQNLGVTSCLEIGTGYKGGLSRFLAQDMGWEVTTVDVKNYGHAFERVHYVVGTPAHFPEMSFDLVFIDGDHSYDCVESDHSWYGMFASKVIAYHDISGARDTDGACEFWTHISTDPLARNRTHEIIDPINPAGIGWIEL